VISVVAGCSMPGITNFPLCLPQ